MPIEAGSPGREVFIGLGSNLGNPLANLQAGLAGMAGIPGYRQLAVSAPYRTAPVGPQDQPPFVNAVARGLYSGEALDLLGGLLAVEKACGRQRGRRWGPRILDLDLLLFGQEVIETQGLKVPHPEIVHRAFVLVPLMELAPDMVLPRWGKTAAQLWQGFSPQERRAQKVEKIAWACGA